MKLVALLWSAEAAKAIQKRDTSTLSMFDLFGAAPATTPKGPTHQGTAEPTHGGKLHPETRTDKTGRTQTRWIGQEAAPAAPEKPAAPEPVAAPPPEAAEPPSAPPRGKKKPAPDWPTTPPKRNEVEAMQAWLAAAPPGARLQAGTVSLEKREVDLPKVGGIWRLSGSRETISSEALAVQLGPPLEPSDGGDDREWERRFRKPTPEELEGTISAATPGAGQIQIDDPVIQAEIPTAYVGRFKAAVDKLQKRAAKLGLQPLTFEVTGTGMQSVTMGHPPDEITYHVPTTTFMVVMPDLSLPGGWKFIGAVEHGENGNKVHMRHKPEGVDTKAFRLHENTCDHCRTNRQRKLTVVLQSRDGEIKRVGSDCMKDYLGHDVPLVGWNSIYDAMKAELYGEVDESWNEGMVRNATGAKTEDFMAAVARNIREDGRFVSRSNAGMRDTPTADAAWQDCTDIKSGSVSAAKKKLTEADEAAAARVIAWARAIPENTDNDFLHNVRVSLAGPTVMRGDAGFAAAAFSAMARDNAKRGIADPNAPKGKHVGVVGDKIGTGRGHALRPVTGVVISRRYIEGQYGSFLIKVRGDDGNTYTTFASRPNYENMDQGDPAFLTAYGLIPKRGKDQAWEGSPEVGDRLKITGGSVKKHDEFRGEKQNVLTRATFERMDIPDYSEARLPVEREQAADGRGVMVPVTNPWTEHEIAFLDHAVAEAQRQGHMPGDEHFALAFTKALKEAKQKWPHDFGAHHFVQAEPKFKQANPESFTPYTTNEWTDHPRTEIGLRNLLAHKRREAREYATNWTEPSPEEYQRLLDETLERGRAYPSQHGKEAGKSLIAFTFRREALKDQFGLFGTYARAASAANPGHWGGGGAAAPGTHVELRTDKTGRTEHRTVKDSAPPAAPQKAKPPMQLGIFGGETPEKRPAPLKVVGAAPQRARLAVRPACSRCGQTIPRLDPHADGKTCGTCLHTIDWVHEAGARPALSGSLFG